MNYVIKILEFGKKIAIVNEDQSEDYILGAELLRSYSPQIKYRNQDGKIIYFPNLKSNIYINYIKLDSKKDSGAGLTFSDDHKAFYNWDYLLFLGSNKSVLLRRLYENLVLQEQGKIQMIY